MRCKILCVRSQDLEHLQQCSVCGPAKLFFSHPSFSYLLFSNSTHKTEIGTANRWRLVIATHLYQSNYPANQKQEGAVNKYNLTLFTRLFQSVSRPWKMCIFPGSRISLPVDPLDMTAAPHPRFPVHGHILSTCGEGETETERSFT